MYNILTNRVGPYEVWEDRHAEAKLDVTSDKGLATGEDIEELDVEVKSYANVDETTLNLGLSSGHRIVGAAGSSKSSRR
jgi:hypothetical protein